MRLVMVMVLAGLAALPLSVSAQDADESATVEPSADESAPPSEPAPEEPALQLQLDAAGVDVKPSPPRTPDRYTLEEMNVRVRRAKIGLAVTPVPTVVGALLAGSQAVPDFCLVDCPPPPTPEELAREDRLIAAGATLAVLGGASMIATGILLGVRKRQRRELRRYRPPYSSTPPRVQWDLARSRLVF